MTNTRATELWFRKKREESLQQNQLTTTIRLGDRTGATLNPKCGYSPGQSVKLRIHLGGEQFGNWHAWAIITEVEQKSLGHITAADLTGTLFETIAALREELDELYGREIQDTDQVTLIRFRHIDTVYNAAELIELGTLQYADLPKSNPNQLRFIHYTLPLIAHDYPAKTAVMWNVVYQAFELPVRNVMLVGNPDDAEAVLQVLRRDPKYLGGGAGVGFKEKVIPFLDEVDRLVDMTGSTNFILKDSTGKLVGFNTDGEGYAMGLEQAFLAEGETDLRHKKVILLGAGGTANAIAFALTKRGMKLIIVNRTLEKGKDLAEKLNRSFPGKGTPAKYDAEHALKQLVFNADVIVNASTKGTVGSLEKYSALAPALLPASPENIEKNLVEAAEVLSLIPRYAIVSDVILGKEPTPLIKTAQAAGYTVLDGLPMVINQGVEAFWLLHGQELEAKGVKKEELAAVMKKAAHQ
jgi:shikimate dehydrogenase